MNKSIKQGGASELAAGPARVLIVPDKFKGTLGARGVCAALARGWKAGRPQDRLELLPMSDGGDGFGEVMGRLLKAQVRRVNTLDAAHRPVAALWWWEEREKLAIIEAARVIGLARLPVGRFHPFQLDTFGLGRVVEQAMKAGAEGCVIGIGGSATNDGGFGLARALGWRFLDGTGGELDQWWQLTKLVRVAPPKSSRKLEITVATDVRNPLLGPAGCARVYGPQKGLAKKEMAFAERCLGQMAEVLERQLGSTHAETPGAGAAGGLGYGLMTFAGAKARGGFEVFAEAAGLEERIRQADLVITGEGLIDRQSHMGKGVGQVMRWCKRLGTQCIAVGGAVDAGGVSRSQWWQTRALTEIAALEAAKSDPARHLERMAEMMAREETKQVGKHAPSPKPR